MMETGADKVLEAVGGLVSDFHEALEMGPAMVNAAVVVVDVVQEDGSRAVLALSTSLEDYEVRGLMHEALSDLDAHKLATYVEFIEGD